MRLAVSTYSFHQKLKTGEMSYMDCLPAAKQMGFEGVELVGIERVAEGDTKAFAEQIRKEAERLGLTLSNYCFSADFVNAEGGMEAELARVKTLIDLAEILGVPSVRHDVLGSLGDYPSFETALPDLSAACREVTMYAESKGIRTMVENHGFVCQGSSRVRALYEAVGHKNFSLLADMGNFLCVDENPVDAVKAVLPYAAYVHMKDFYVFSPEELTPKEQEGCIKTSGGNYIKGAVVGEGDAMAEQVIAVLKDGGYDGWLTLEYEGAAPALEAIAQGYTNLNQFLTTKRD